LDSIKWACRQFAHRPAVSEVSVGDIVNLFVSSTCKMKFKLLDFSATMHRHYSLRPMIFGRTVFRSMCRLLFLGYIAQSVGFPLCAQTSADAAELTNQADTTSPGQNSQAGPAGAPDPIIAYPNRPTFSTTAESVQSGVFEIEYGFEVGDGHQNINGLLKFGLTKNLELRFGNNPIERDSAVTGLGDSSAGFKYKIVEEKSWYPTFSVLYAATIPTASARLGAGAVGHSAGVLISQDFGKHHFDFNETVQWVGRRGGGGYDRNYFTALAYGRGLTGKWGMTAEIAGFSRTNAALPATMTIMGAATYSVSSRFIFDTGIYIAAYGDLPRVTFFSGVTYSVGDLYHRRKGRDKGAD
jgi:Putative MetA-pathway of phenol degradation